jgi:hypothetical protein
MRPLTKVLFLALIGTLSEAPAQTAGGPPGGAIEAIVIDRKDPAIVYTTADWSGVFKSIDGGQHWTANSTGLTKTAVHSLAVDPLNVYTLYVRTDAQFFT